MIKDWKIRSVQSLWLAFRTSRANPTRPPNKQTFNGTAWPELVPARDNTIYSLPCNDVRHLTYVMIGSRVTRVTKSRLVKQIFLTNAS